MKFIAALVILFCLSITAEATFMPLYDPYAIHVDGTDALTANWNAGGYQIEALNFNISSGETYGTILEAENASLENDITLTFDLSGSHTLTINGSPTLANWFDQTVKTIASPTFAGETVTTTGTSTVLIEDSGADTGGGNLYLRTNRGGGASSDNDYCGFLGYQFDDSGGNLTTGVDIYVQVIDNTDTTEDADLIFREMVAGTLTEVMRFNAGNVGMGTASPAASLHILNDDDNANVTIFNLEGKRPTPANNDTMYIYYRMNNSTPTSFEYARTTITADDITAGEEEGSLLFEVARAGSLETVLKMSPTEIVLNEPGADRDFRVEASGVANALSINGADGAITMGSSLAVTGTVSGATGSTFGNLTLADGSITDSGGSISFGDENLSTTGTVSGGVMESAAYGFPSDADTFISSVAGNAFYFQAGGTEMARYSWTSKNSTGYFVINNDGADVDTQIEAVGQEYALFVQGSDGKVGIRDSEPAEVLDVTGNINVTGVYKVGDTSGVSGTLELDDGSTEKITLVFTGGILTSRTVGATTGSVLADWTD